ncbi:MAG TPA: hypothetical protein VLL54_16325 [Pyrinomonadaceae bacterium]|nr:hypothetical protein [Pyrinomonadaceae bacterium]
MKRILLLVIIGAFAFMTGIVAHALARKPTPPAPEARGVPVTKVTIESDAPISIGRITKATARVFNVELLNVSGKTIVGFDYTYYKQCAKDTIPAGGAMGFRPEKLLKPGDKVVFDAGEDAEVRETDIQNCIDTAKEIRIQIKTVSFTDGSTWTARPGDFNGIRSR